MMLDQDALKTLLCERLCQEVAVEQRPDGTLMLRTHFEFPDGDSYPFYLSEAASGGLRLSDRGHTLMHISYEHDIDSFLDGTRGVLMEKIEAETSLERKGGEFHIDTSAEKLAETIFAFGQALTRIYDLTLLSRSNVGSTFYDDLAKCLSGLIGEEKIQRNYQPHVPNSEAYPVDYRIKSQNNIPLFLYGVPNRDKARLTTIMLNHFHRHKLPFESIIVFENQAEIPRADLARLSDVGGDMISSLNATEDLDRKLKQRVA